MHTSIHKEKGVFKYTMEKLVIGILAHVDAGKTTLSEGILYLTGKIRKLGRVDHKDAYLDTYNLERERGITIFSKQAEFELGNRGITLLDTPGHVDFSAEMERTGSGLCDSCDKWCRWRAGTYHDLMETSGEISDPDVPVYQ